MLENALKMFKLVLEVLLIIKFNSDLESDELLYQEPKDSTAEVFHRVLVQRRN